MHQRSESIEELTKTADFLVAHARREDAISLVAASVASTGGQRGVLLLARLQLEAGTQEGAACAAGALERWRRRHPWDLEAIVLLRDALTVLGRERAVSKLDRDVRWSALGGAPFPRSMRRARREHH
ncbi:MAG: hypothetical protein U0610_33495 [bacterium]